MIHVELLLTMTKAACNLTHLLRQKLKFCHSYADCRPGDEETGSTEARYARAYEARVNPFTDFQNREMEARVSDGVLVLFFLGMQIITALLNAL